MLVPSLIDGLLLGFVYGVAAMGLSLIWGVMDVINLSHGPIIALGMFGIYLAFNGLGMNPYLTLLLIAAGGLLLGILIYGVAVHRVINAPHLSTLLATFSVNMILIGIGTAVFTTSPRNVDFSIGSLSAAIVHPREVFKFAILANAASVILAHNHPSGDTAASQDDIELTRRLVEAGRIMGIEVLDHLVVGGQVVLSFKQHGLI